MKDRIEEGMHARVRCGVSTLRRAIGKTRPGVATGGDTNSVRCTKIETRNRARAREAGDAWRACSHKYTLLKISMQQPFRARCVRLRARARRGRALPRRLLARPPIHLLPPPPPPPTHSAAPLRRAEKSPTSRRAPHFFFRNREPFFGGPFPRFLCIASFSLL